MTSAVKQGETLALITAAAELPAALVRTAALARLWAGPTALVVLGESDQTARAAERLPDNVRVVAAGGAVAEALAVSALTPHAVGAATALLAAAAAAAPLARILLLADADLLHLLPSFAAAAVGCPVDVELLAAAAEPDQDLLWEHADGLLLADDRRLYQLAAAQPALPVRVAPLGADEATLNALRQLPMLGAPLRTSVVVPVRGSGDLVARMAHSVCQRTSNLLELILVDDASPDRTAARLEGLAARDARVRLLVHAEQRGFAASCNQGLTVARGDVVIVLNADTVVTAGWADRLVHHLLHQPRAGAVGPLSNRVSGLQHFAPVDYDEHTLAGLEPFAERLARAAGGRAVGVVRLTGLCLALGRPALRQVGGFDPRFFPGNYEDDDYCLRLLAGGLAPYRADDVFIHHEGSRSFALEPQPYRVILEANWARFKTKWGLPADRPLERHYSAEELPLHSCSRAQRFIAPWKALEPLAAN